MKTLTTLVAQNQSVQMINIEAVRESVAANPEHQLPGEPKPKKARQCRSNVKVLLIAFFDWQGVVYHEFTPNGQTINK